MKQADKAPDTTYPTKHHLRFDHHNAIVGAVVLVVLLAAAITWIIVQRNHKHVVKVTPSSVVTKALRTQGGATEQELKDALNSNPTNTQKIQLLQLLANKAEQKGDFVTTVSYLKQAYDAGLTDPLLTQNIGMLYLNKLSDKPQALKYLKISLEEAKKSQATYAANLIATLNKTITQLEGQGVTAAN